MRRPKELPVDPATLPPPAVIARQIAGDLKAALREFEALARDLEQPQAPPEPVGQQLAIEL